MSNLYIMARITKEIKKRKSKNCPCRLCKTYIPIVGFIYFCLLLSLYLFLWNTFRSRPPETFLWRVFFPLLLDQFMGEHSDIVFILCIYCVLLECLFYRNIYGNFFIYFLFIYVYVSLFFFLLIISCILNVSVL